MPHILFSYIFEKYIKIRAFHPAYVASKVKFYFLCFNTHASTDKDVYITITKIVSIFKEKKAGERHTCVKDEKTIE